MISDATALPQNRSRGRSGHRIEQNDASPSHQVGQNFRHQERVGRLGGRTCRTAPCLSAPHRRSRRWRAEISIVPPIAATSAWTIVERAMNSAGSILRGRCLSGGGIASLIACLRRLRLDTQDWASRPVACAFGSLGLRGRRHRSRELAVTGNVRFAADRHMADKSDQAFRS